MKQAGLHMIKIYSAKLTTDVPNRWSQIMLCHAEIQVKSSPKYSISKSNVFSPHEMSLSMSRSEKALVHDCVMQTSLPLAQSKCSNVAQYNQFSENFQDSTTSQNQLWSRFGKLFFPSSPDVPALLPSAMLPRQARGTHKKQFTKPTPQFILGRSIYIRQLFR